MANSFRDRASSITKTQNIDDSTPDGLCKMFQAGAGEIMLDVRPPRRFSDLGVTLIAADSPTSFLDDGPTSKLIRQILGAVSEFDKAMIVAKLKGARDRARRARGKCEGRKSYAERAGGEELVSVARQLRANPDGGRLRSLRKVAAGLAERGYVTPSGRPYSASAVSSMLRAS